MNRWRLTLNILLFLALNIVLYPQAQTDEPDAPLIALRQATTVYSGPGITYRDLTTIDADNTAEITLLSRNTPGNWVQLVISADDVTVEGWTLTGHLVLDESIRFSDIPPNTILTDAAPYNVDDERMARLFSVPVIPQLDAAMIDVFERGQANCLQADSITKIGDSLSVSPIFLTPMQRDDHRLGAYDYLAESITHFGASMAGINAASQVGLNTNSVLDSMWASPQLCERGESPLQCEFRRKMPAVAVILFGPNDAVSRMTVDDYAGQMQQIIEETLHAGVIPLILTFSAHPQSHWWEKALDFNLALVDLADEYRVPLVNLWSAARALPNYGLARDNIHMRHGTFQYFNFTTGHEASVGVALQNLVTLAAIHEIYTALELDSVNIAGANPSLRQLPVQSCRQNR